MLERMIFIVTLLSAIGCGIVGGAFFAFSTFVMRALVRLPAPQGIAAMQSINIVVINPWFMTAMFGTAALCIVAMGWALTHWQRAGAGYLLGGGLMYVIGTILVTIAFNVPRNNALAVVDPASEQGARLWANYASTWTVGNHVRTAAALVASALFMLAIANRGTVE